MQRTKKLIDVEIRLFARLGASGDMNLDPRVKERLAMSATITKAEMLAHFRQLATKQGLRWPGTELHIRIRMPTGTLSTFTVPSARLFAALLSGSAPNGVAILDVVCFPDPEAGAKLYRFDEEPDWPTAVHDFVLDENVNGGVQEGKLRAFLRQSVKILKIAACSAFIVTIFIGFIVAFWVLPEELTDGYKTAGKAAVLLLLVPVFFALLFPCLRNLWLFCMSKRRRRN